MNEAVVPGPLPPVGVVVGVVVTVGGTDVGVVGTEDGGREVELDVREVELELEVEVLEVVVGLLEPGRHWLYHWLETTQVLPDWQHVGPV